MIEPLFDPLSSLEEMPHLDIHIRIQQRNGRKSLTTIQGLPQKNIELKSLLKTLKKSLATNGAIIDSEELGPIMQLHGDQRETIRTFLVEQKIATLEDIKVHGA